MLGIQCSEGPSRCVRLNRNGTRCQHNISELAEILRFQGLWKFLCSKCGELVAVAFLVRRSDIGDARRLGARGRWIFACVDPLLARGIRRARSLAKKSFDEPGELEKSPPCPRAQSFAQKMLELWYTDCVNGLLQLTLTKTKP